MPITKSAEKALRQSKRRAAKNLKDKESYKSVFKEFKKLAAGGKKDEAQKMLPKVFKKVDKAAKNQVINKNKASRLKSSASRMLK